MKKLLLILLMIIHGLGVNAQSPITLDTAPIQGTQIVILPTCNNLLRMLGATNIQFAGAMKRYHYQQARADYPNSFGATGGQKRFIASVTKDKDAITLSLSELTVCTSLLEYDIKNHFPDAKLSTNEDGNKAYTFTVKNDKGKHR